MDNAAGGGFREAKHMSNMDTNGIKVPGILQLLQSRS